MKELTELEDAIKNWDKSDCLHDNVNEAYEMAIAAQRLITRLKECDLGECEWEALKRIRMAEFGIRADTALGKLYFVAEESET